MQKNTHIRRKHVLVLLGLVVSAASVFAILRHEELSELSGVPSPQSTSTRPHIESTSTASTTAPRSTSSMSSTSTATPTPYVTPEAPRALQPTPQAVPGTSTAALRWKRAVTTVFWVGEEEDEDNGFIHNRASAWNEDWMGSFGGEDDPDLRCGYRPCAFTPRENTFYVALPYYEYDENGAFRENAKRIPWYTPELMHAGLLLKNRWVAVRANDKTCYGQWADVGPFETNDFEYVFGDAPHPKNTQGLAAGLDVSPAMRDCLGLSGNDITYWTFMDAALVPSGPWKEVVTGAP